MRAAQDLDPLGPQAQLDLVAAVLGLARCVDEILIPATQELRRMLATGLCESAQQLMATEAIRTWLNHRGSFAPPPQEIGPILLACGPRDRDTVGLESLALLLRFERRPCRVLGARISTFTLTIARQAADAVGVVVMSTESRGLPQAVTALLAVDALGIPVFFAGTAFEPEHSRRQLPGRYLGTRMGGACTQLIDKLAPAVKRRSAAVHSPGSELRSCAGCRRGRRTTSISLPAARHEDLITRVALVCHQEPPARRDQPAGHETDRLVAVPYAEPQTRQAASSLGRQALIEIVSQGILFGTLVSVGSEVDIGATAPARRRPVHRHDPSCYGRSAIWGQSTRTGRCRGVG